MTEKRFTINGTWGKSLNRLKGVICDNNKDMYITDVVNLLNDFSEENEQLKQTIDRLTLDNTKQKKVLNATKKENEQLKLEIQKLKNVSTK